MTPDEVESSVILGHADEWHDWTQSGCERAAQMMELLVADRDLLLQAVNVIAGNAQCADNLLSHKDVALEALRLR